MLSGCQARRNEANVSSRGRRISRRAFKGNKSVLARFQLHGNVEGEEEGTNLWSTYLLQTLLNRGGNLSPSRILCGDEHVVPRQPTLAERLASLRFVSVRLSGVCQTKN